MTTSYLIRQYHDGDESAIVPAFEEAFHKPLELEAWRWKYRYGGQSPTIAIGERDGEIVAQYAVYPIPVVIDGRHVTAGQPADVFCLKRPGSATRRIYLRCYQDLVSRNCGPGRRYQLLMGFPSARALRQGQLLMGYPTDPPRVPVWTRKVAGRVRSRLTRILRHGRAVIGDRCSAADIDRLWDASHHRYPVTVPRDGDWITRRYHSRPGGGYIHRLSRRDGRVRVWSVFRPRGPILDWVDLLWDGTDPADLLSAEAGAQNLCRRGGQREIRMWLMGDAEAEKVFAEAGWTADRGESLWFAHRFYDDSVEPDLPFAQGFYLTMGVSDHV